MPDTMPSPATTATPRAMLPRVVISLRENPSALRRVVVLTLAVLVGLAISVFVLIAAGVPGENLADEFITNTLSDPDSVRAILVQAAPLMLVGAGAALAFRVNYWNLGLEGQMIFGGIASTWIVLHNAAPAGATLFIMAVAACVGGLAWGVLPAILKLRLGVNEIISTLLLNYVAQNFLLHLVYGAWLDPKDNFPHSPEFPPTARLPDFDVGISISTALPIAVIVALAGWWLVTGTRLGLYMRFAQANPRMSTALGVPLNATILASVLLSAAASGLAGFLISAGEEGRLTQSFYTGYGFSGILIAFLARNNPLAAIPVSLAIAWLFVTGQSLQVFYQIPFAMVQLIQAIIVVAVAASEFSIRHRVKLVR
jgi:simple sugar transport system permease protein